METLRARTAGRNRSFPVKHAKRKDKYAASQRGLENIVMAEETKLERIKGIYQAPKINKRKQIEQMNEVREIRRKAQPGDLSPKTERKEPTLNEMASRLAKEWGLK